MLLYFNTVNQHYLIRKGMKRLKMLKIREAVWINCPLRILLRGLPEDFQQILRLSKL